MANAVLTSYLLTVFALAAPVFAQQRFDSADAAAQAVIDSAEKHDGVRLAAIFGPPGNTILTSGNPTQDRGAQSEFSQLAARKHRLIVDPRNSNRVILSIGDKDWPSRFPSFVQTENGVSMRRRPEGKCRRRIDAHELDAIEICAGYVGAQQKYAFSSHESGGMFQYASHMSGSADGRGGLGTLAPQGLADATWDGQKNALTPYHGYFFRILDGQGPHAPGGAHDYRVKNNLMGGFGLIAWPAQYGVTGILTFIVNPDGVIYQKDIAPLPGSAVVPITRYDPDPTWRAVN